MTNLKTNLLGSRREYLKWAHSLGQSEERLLVITDLYLTKMREKLLSFLTNPMLRTHRLLRISWWLLAMRIRLNKRTTLKLSWASKLSRTPATSWSKISSPVSPMLNLSLFLVCTLNFAIGMTPMKATWLLWVILNLKINLKDKGLCWIELFSS